jgi:hypothetical protein
VPAALSGGQEAISPRQHKKCNRGTAKFKDVHGCPVKEYMYMGPVNSMFGNMILISDATGTGARNIVQRDSGLMPRKCSQEVRASFSWTVPSYESADQHPECTATSPNISNIQNILKFGRCRTLTCNLHPTDLLGCQHHWLCGLGGPRPTGPWEFFPRDAPRISKVNYIYGVYIYIYLYLSIYIIYIYIIYLCVCGGVVAVRVAGSSGVLGAQGTWMAAASAKS